MNRDLTLDEIAKLIKKEAGVVRHVINSTFPRYEGKDVIYAPEGRNADELYVLAHECGHAAFRHKRRTPKWLAEYQAETWAIDILQKYGVPASKARTKRGKGNVRMEIDAAWEFDGYEEIAKAAAKWAGTSIPQ